MEVIFISLMLIFILAFILNNREIISPAVLFSGSFLFSSFWALLYAQKWSLSPNIKTQLVIILGVLLFVVISTTLRYIFMAMYPKKVINDSNSGILFTLPSINRYKIILIIFIELLTIIVTLKFLKSISSASLADNIHTYRLQLTFGSSTDRISPPMIFNVLRMITSSFGYYTSYLAVRTYVLEHKLNILLLIAVILSAISSLITGGRGGLITIIVAIGFFYYLVSKQQNNWHRLILTQNIRKIAGIIIIFIVLIVGFQDLALLLGREITVSQFDYLAEYFGAQFKNLDIFLTNNIFPVQSNIKGSQTLYYFWKLINKVIAINGSEQPLVLPFNSINGYDLGNVATTFYPYLYDFGYTGVILFTTIMAIISESLYQKVKYIYKNSNVSLLTLIYGAILGNALTLVFFSNQFYERLFSSGTIYTIICWVLFNFYFYRFSLKDK